MPRSRLGSNKDANITYPRKARHDAFHAWASHREIGNLIRTMLYHTVGQDGMTPEPESLSPLLLATKTKKWQSLYKPEALVTADDPATTVQSVEAMQHMLSRLNEEADCVGDMLEQLRDDGRVRTHSTLHFADSLRFFGVHKGLGATKALLTEGHGEEYLWSKSLQHEVRERMIGLLDTTPLYSLRDRGVQRDLECVLASQQSRIKGVQVDWLQQRQALLAKMRRILREADDQEDQRARRRMRARHGILRMRGAR